MKPAVRVENLSKSYRIGNQTPKGQNLTESLAHGARSAWDKFRRLVNPDASQAGTHDYWALNDVSFEVPEGEVVGIIGRNGAGKSTLLKILSRIVEPTGGFAEINGRVGSLLEVGTGFHPELTGRENIYLNGTILGMRRREIDRKFDEIVAFAGIDEFLDTPVKRYSSGMGVRLGFSVAAHLEPEILIVDEVLAVGDQQFQDKCIGRMQDVAQSGATVLFVSHQLGSLRKLCTSAVMLEAGRVAKTGQTEEIISLYLGTMSGKASIPVGERLDRKGNGVSRIIELEVYDSVAKSRTLTTGQPVHISFRVSRVLPGMICRFTIYDPLGQPVFDTRTNLLSGENNYRCDIEQLLLIPGTYRMNASLMSGKDFYDHVEGISILLVTEGIINDHLIKSSRYGYMHQPHRWRTEN